MKGVNSFGGQAANKQRGESRMKCHTCAAPSHIQRKFNQKYIKHGCICIRLLRVMIN